MGHAFNVRLVIGSSQMNVLCDEAQLRKIEKNADNSRVLDVFPIDHTSTGTAIVFDASRRNSSDHDRTITDINDNPEIRFTTSNTLPDMESDDKIADWNEPRSLDLQPIDTVSWMEGYELQQAAASRRRLARYAFVITVFGLLPLSALLALA